MIVHDYTDTTDTQAIQAEKAERRIPVFVDEGSVVNPDDVPPGYVLIYVKVGATPPYFGPLIF